MNDLKMIVLSGNDWPKIEPYFKPVPNKLGPKPNTKKTLEGILHRLSYGCTWAELPKQYGNSQWIMRKNSQWIDSGAYKRLKEACLDVSCAELLSLL